MPSFHAKNLVSIYQIRVEYHLVLIHFWLLAVILGSTTPEENANLAPEMKDGPVNAGPSFPTLLDPYVLV
jgi:hypothetical protein